MGTRAAGKFEDWAHQRLLWLTGIVPLQTAAATPLQSAPASWAARRPEWWTLAISLAAWFILIASARNVGVPLCSSTPRSPWSDAAFGWMVMTLAMMPPLVAPSVRHVAFRSLRERRQIAIAEFLAGYLGLWLLVGVGMIGLSFAIGPVRSGTEARIVAIAAYGAAILWQFTPAKRRALWRCHRTVALALDGWRADFACLRYGVGAGRDCVSSCWILMALPLLAPHSLAVMACVQAAMLAERYQRARHVRRARSIWLLCTAFLLDVY